jgi:hypothetical protein
VKTAKTKKSVSFWYKIQTARFSQKIVRFIDRFFIQNLNKNNKSIDFFDLSLDFFGLSPNFLGFRFFIFPIFLKNQIERTGF